MSRAQLLASGISSSAIGRMTVAGSLHRVHRNVYAVGHTAPAPLAAETAALLACGGGAVLSHLTAAVLWKIVPERLADGLIHVTVPGRHGAQPRGVRLHRTQCLTPQEIRMVDRLPVTSPAKTALTLAELLDNQELMRAVDEALLRRLVSRRHLEQVAHEAAGRRGAARLASAIRRHAIPQVTRSEAERRFYELMRQAELPLPQANVRLQGYEVDFYWPAHRLVVEIDGYRYHSSRPAFERDSAKGARMVAAGLQFMRVTWLQMERHALVVVARVAQALVRGEAGLTAG